MTMQTIVNMFSPAGVTVGIETELLLLVLKKNPKKKKKSTEHVSDSLCVTQVLTFVPFFFFFGLIFV